MTAPASDGRASGVAAIPDPTGLHARPAVKVTKLAKTFVADVEIAAGAPNGWVNAKSPNKVMKLRAAHGEQLHVRAIGTDADAAVAAIIALVERNFDG